MKTVFVSQGLFPDPFDSSKTERKSISLCLTDPEKKSLLPSLEIVDFFLTLCKSISSGKEMSLDFFNQKTDVRRVLRNLDVPFQKKDAA